MNENKIMKTPEYLQFKTENNNDYIYDPCTNRVFSCPEPMEYIVKNFYVKSYHDIQNDLQTDFDENHLLRIYTKVKQLIEKEQAFFPPEHITRSNFSEKDFWDQLWSQPDYRLILIITEDCNFRCKYCGYSGIYEGERTHCNKKMSWTIAKKSIDYYINITDAEKINFLPGNGKRALQFYGGEPLLEFKLMKKCVQYIKTKINPRELTFQITTNASLLNDEIMDFLVRENFVLSISFDGPKEEHDRNRIFKNKKPTFDIVYNKILKYQSQYPDYFNEKVGAISVLDYHSNLIKINDFFNLHKNIIKPIRANYVNSKNTDYYSQFTHSEIEEHNKQLKLVFENYAQNLNNDCQAHKHITIADNIYGSQYKPVLDRYYTTQNSYTGACSPGRKIAVDPDGNFHLCEKMNYHFSIGNCFDGFDYKKIKNVLAKYQKQIVEKKNCKNCIARRVCGECFATVASGENFNPPNCEESLDYFKTKLMRIYTILENNPRPVLKNIRKSESFTLLDSII